MKRPVKERGFQSAVSLPLVVEGPSIGALTVQGDVINAFGAIEVEAPAAPRRRPEELLRRVGELVSRAADRPGNAQA